jgi:diacylglycerol kinase family enzyme
LAGQPANQPSIIVVTTYRNATLIYNPTAGGLNGGRTHRLDRVLRVLREAGHTVTPVETQGPGTATVIAHGSVEAGADLILVAGGDGTVNEALNGVVHGNVPLALLPAGTGNVLGTELRLGGLNNAASKLGRWIPKRVAAGLLRTGGGTSRYFLLMAGVGLDARVVNNVDLKLKRRSGKLSYCVAGFQQLGRSFEEFDVRLNGESHRCSFALGSRVRNYGGVVEIARQASLFRDDFEVVLFEGRNSFVYLKFLFGAVSRTLSRMGGVRVLRATRVELPAAPGRDVFVQVDGELAGRLPASIEIAPDAVTLLVPPEFTG